MNTFATTLLAAIDKGFMDPPIEDQQTIPLALMQKWLREKYKLDLTALPYTAVTDGTTEKKWMWMVHRTSASLVKTNPAEQLFNSYEEALLAGIAEALTLLP